jgi:hypothetical protein
LQLQAVAATSSFQYNSQLKASFDANAAAAQALLTTHVNAFDVDKIKSSLLDALEQERAALLAHIARTQVAMDESLAASTAAPSVQELQV